LNRAAADLHRAEWAPLARTPVLQADKVHVWLAPLWTTARRLEQLHRSLNADEISRAEAFHFRRDRDRFVVARGLLRHILGRYLGQEPSRLRFRYTPEGKPDLLPEHGGQTLRFNLSHSGGLALYAITRQGEIGVDIEQFRSDFADLQVARQFFSPREIAALRGLPPNRRTSTFFILWTLKEAYLKADGTGLGVGLDHFDVSSALVGKAILRRADSGAEVPGWSLRMLDPGPGYAAALVVQGAADHVECWRWSGQ
jgi:4'-phosphopantetheinyl transferase